MPAVNAIANAPQKVARRVACQHSPRRPRTGCAEQAKKDERRNQNIRERRRRPHRKGRRRGQRRWTGRAVVASETEFVPRVCSERIFRHQLVGDLARKLQR
jgi:hypothetical protein